MKPFLLSLIAVSALVAGCDVPPAKQDLSASAPPKAEAAVADPHSDPTATPREGEKSLDDLKKSYEAAKAEFEKAKDDAGKKKFYVDETVVYATAMMLDPNLGPKQKYPGALKLYREAIAIDPINKEAKENIAMIEEIYRSMKLDIPK